MTQGSLPDNQIPDRSDAAIGIAVDIGTTTIAAALADRNGIPVRSLSCANSGAAFGADVMSRIRAATEGHAGDLQERLRADISDLLAALTESGAPKASVRERKRTPQIIVLAGNTTMLHLLNGYDCAGLGKYPYTPFSLAAEERTAGELFPKLPSSWHDVRVLELPGISAFVGADIVSGLYAVDALQLPAGRTALFLDLGTNGEMALIQHFPTEKSPSQDTRHTHGSVFPDELRLTVCSTAAGPVFEGAGIVYGMRGDPGAICGVVLVPKTGLSKTGDLSPTAIPAGSTTSADPRISGSQEYSSTVHARCRTIGNLAPAGICGSGVLEAVSELARLHLVDHDGLLAEPWFSKGFPLAGPRISEGSTPDGASDLPCRAAKRAGIRLYQEDIRAVQLAKAAVRAGAQTLLTSQGLPRDAVDTVWIAGAFGSALSFSRLAPLGLLPPKLLPLCRSEGNTSLRGAVLIAAAFLCGQGKQALETLEQICKAATELPLAGRQDFEALYLASMAF